jgi:pre-mRNA-processing factor 39
LNESAEEIAEQEPELVEAEVSENNEEQVTEIIEDTDHTNTLEVLAQLQELAVPAETVETVEETDMGQGQESKDESSSNFAFEEFPTDALTYEQSSNEKEEKAKEDVFIADLAEENANSLPSGCDENSRNDSAEKIVENSEFDLPAQEKPEDPEPELVAENIVQEEEETPVEETVVETIEEEKPEVLEEEKPAEVVEMVIDSNDVPDKPADQNDQTGESDFAIAETLENGTNEATDLDAEMVSEDELPAPDKPKVQDAEEVSDDELPGPKMAELPADTEVVSEEEMPNKDEDAAAKKDAVKRKIEDYDPNSPTDDSEAPEKKLKTDSDSEKEKPKPKLPDLDKYWKAVNDDTTDFTAWTYLLQYVDQEVNLVVIFLKNSFFLM